MAIYIEEGIKKCPLNHCEHAGVKVIRYKGNTEYLGTCNATDPKEYQEAVVLGENAYKICGRHS